MVLTRKWRIVLLIVSLLSVSASVYLLFWVSPTMAWHVNNIFRISPILILLGSLTLSVFSLVAFLSRKVVQGVILGCTMLIFLLLRYFGITHWLFILFLFLLVALLEVLVYQS